MAHDIFISYCHQDKSTADAACAVLESEQLRCWIAPRDILPGSEWAESVMDGIAGAKALVLIFSRQADQSPQVRREVERAIHHALPVVPVRIEDCLPGKAMEYLISAPHWLDAITPPLESHFRQLAASLKILIRQHPPNATGSEIDNPPARAIAYEGPRPNIAKSTLAASLAAVIVFAGIFGIWQFAHRPSTVQATPKPATLPANPPTPSPSAAHQLIGGHWLAQGMANGQRITVNSEFRPDGTLLWNVSDAAGNLIAHGIGKYTVDAGGHYTFTGDFNDESQITWIDQDHFTIKYLKSTNPAAVIGLDVLNTREY